MHFIYLVPQETMALICGWVFILIVGAIVFAGAYKIYTSIKTKFFKKQKR